MLDFPRLADYHAILIGSLAPSYQNISLGNCVNNTPGEYLRLMVHLEINNYN